ncbi:MAG: 4-hydroxy-tetrahydrodipicolinate reductase [Candidatus Omnitrophica bacterium]|nr:4-hydroxy-tetrahydrodipicolinate reductase [Candidatus Omnitrophota bacterium]
MIKLAVNGCMGKMGNRTVELAGLDSDFKIVLALESKNHEAIGSRINNLTVCGDVTQIKQADVVIDFSSNTGVRELLPPAVAFKKALVIGTTGLSEQELAEVKDAAEFIPILFSPNMSLGVNLLFKLVAEAAEKLKAYKIGITEAHHVHKKDAPSGTAKKLAEILEAKCGKKIENIRSIREGEIIGDHEVRFESGQDVIILKHSAKTRDIFVLGALAAAKWAIKQPKGLYSMQDVLGKY